METEDLIPLDVLERITELFIAEIVADPQVRAEMSKIQPKDVEMN